MSDFEEMFAAVYNSSDETLKKFMRQIAPYMFEGDQPMANTPNPNPPQQPNPNPQPGQAPTQTPNPSPGSQPKG